MYEQIKETETPLSELETFPMCKETWAFSKATYQLLKVLSQDTFYNVEIFL